LKWSQDALEKEGLLGLGLYTGEEQVGGNQKRLTSIKNRKRDRRRHSEEAASKGPTHVGVKPILFK